MESPGDYLKREREQRGVSLLKIFETTRVPMKYLEAIEADRLEAMPHPTFVKGYIRSYCKVLGLDENDAVLRFDVWLSEKESENQEAGKPKPIQELKRAKASPPKPKRETKVPAGLGKIAVVAAGVIVVILAYTLTKRDLSAPEPQVTVPPALEVAATPAPSTEAQPADAMASPESAAPQAAVAPVNAQPLVPVAQPVKPAPAPPAPAAAVKPVQQPLVKPAQQTAPQATTPKTDPVKNVAPADGAVIEQPKNHVLTANAREMVWLKIGIDKSEPVEVLLKQGERVTWTAADNISVVIGNAGGVSLNYNGKTISGLGAPGEVVGLRLPSGTSYKIKTPQAQPAAEAPAAAPDVPEPQVAPAVNMPEVPAAKPVSAPEG